MNGTLEIGEDRTVYTVTVGDGGPRGQDGNSHFWGYNGGDSTFGHEIVAMGGGGGGFFNSSGRDGGSGGGGGWNVNKPGDAKFIYFSEI